MYENWETAIDICLQSVILLRSEPLKYVYGSRAQLDHSRSIMAQRKHQILIGAIQFSIKNYIEISGF